MSNFELSDQDKIKLKNMNLFEGYQCERDPRFWKFIADHNCISILGIIITNCLECPNWKSFRELEYKDKED